MDSPRYNSVLVNKTRIIESLEATKTTRKLAIKFQEKKWTGLTSNPTAEELVDNVLGRIKEDEEDFDIFVEKLKELVGLDQLVATLEKTRYQSKRTPSRDGTPEAATSEQNGRPTTGHKSPDHKSQSSYPKTGSPPNSNTSPGSEKHKVFGKTLDTHDAGYSSAPDEPTTPTPIGIPLSEMSSGASPHTPAVHTVGHVATNDSHIQPCLVLPTTSGHSLERLRRQRKIDVQASHEDDDVIRIRRRRQSEKVESVDKEKEKLLSSLVKVQDKYIKLLEQGHQAHKQKTTWCNCPSTCCNHVVAIVMLIFLLVVLLFAGIWCTVSVLRH